MKQLSLFGFPSAKVPCPKGVGGHAPAPNVATRCKARKAQKLARRQQR